MSTHGAQVHVHDGGIGTSIVTPDTAAAPADQFDERNVFIVYAIIKLDNTATTIQLRSHGGLGGAPDLTLVFGAVGPEASVNLGAQGILFTQGLDVITSVGAGDFAIVFERINRRVA
jgi:hypothetical protein